MIENSFALLRLIMTAKAMDKSFSNIAIGDRIRKSDKKNPPTRGRLISLQQKIIAKLRVRVTKRLISRKEICLKEKKSETEKLKRV